ncbi:MAG: DUF5677 domain-containing protein [Gaiellaceae bacterium]
MIEGTPAEIDKMLDEIESRLLALGAAVNRPVVDALYQRALVALAQRAVGIFRGFTLLAASEAPSAALALMRPAVEYNLTLRFLVARPDLHPDLWAAEGERQSLIMLREFVEDQELVARHQGIDLTEPWVAEREQYIDEVRARALAANVVGVGQKGPVLPGMQTIAVNHGDIATREAYTLAYRSLSATTHGGARAFNDGAFQEERPGWVTFVEELEGMRGNRALNASTFASTLCVLSEPLELGVLEEATILKGALLQLKTVGEDAGQVDS